MFKHLRSSVLFGDGGGGVINQSTSVLGQRGVSFVSGAAGSRSERHDTYMISSGRFVINNVIRILIHIHQDFSLDFFFFLNKPLFLPHVWIPKYRDGEFIAHGEALHS